MTLFWLSAAFIFGVVVGGVMPAPLEIGIAVLVCSLWLVGRQLPGSVLLVTAAAFALGAVRASHGDGSVSRDSLAFYNGRYVTLQGQIVTEPDIRDSGANYVVSVKKITLAGREATVSGQVAVHTSSSQILDYGRNVAMIGRLLTPQNTSRAPYADILRTRGIGSEMNFPRLLDLGAGDSGPLGWIVPLRERLENRINAWLPEPEASLAIAITLGARSASLGDITPILVATGLIHLIAISGIKVAMVAGTVWAVVAGTVRRRLVSLVVSLSTLLVYVLLTGATASGERSALMWALVFLAAYLGRGTVTLVSLGFVAALMVAIDPALPWDIGFQLSTLGTFAIVAFAPPLVRRLRRVPPPFREALAVTIAAQVGTVPIVAAGFHSLSIIGPVANALVLPLLPLLIALGFLLGAVADVGQVAAPVAEITYALLHAVVLTSQALYRSSSAVAVTAFLAPFTAAYYLGLMALAWAVLRRANWAPAARWSDRRHELVLSLLVAATVATPFAAAASARNGMTYLGTGGAMLLQWNGRNVLIDGSPHAKRLLEALGRHMAPGDHNIDLVVVTDPRAQNVTGLLAVLQHYSVSRVLDVGAEHPAAAYATWRTALRRRGTYVFALRPGVRVALGSVALTGEGPIGLCSVPQQCAGMVLVSSPSGSMLLTGIADATEQTERVFSAPSVRAGTLILDGSHGASQLFIRSVGARTLWSREALPRSYDGRLLREGREVYWRLVP